MKRFLEFAVLGLIIATLAFPAGAAFASADKASPAPEPSLSGKVVETMNAGGYTYVSIEKAGKKTWVAIPMAEVKVGQEMTFQPGAEMRSFTSKSLNRTFDSIIFSGGPVKTGSAGGAKPSDSQHSGKAADASKSTEKIKVEKAAGPDAYTVSEIHGKAATLNEKSATVKGKVVKVSESIMGKNWVHLQDGTGDAAEGTNKLVTTSKDLPAVGDIVTMKGTIYKDKDFGSGYKFTVIMEKAVIVK